MSNAVGFAGAASYLGLDVAASESDIDRERGVLVLSEVLILDGLLRLLRGCAS